MYTYFIPLCESRHVLPFVGVLNINVSYIRVTLRYKFIIFIKEYFINYYGFGFSCTESHYVGFVSVKIL